jgi:hypothetical protein
MERAPVAKGGVIQRPQFLLESKQLAAFWDLSCHPISWSSVDAMQG